MFLKSLAFYITAAIAEISGCFAFWAWLRLHSVAFGIECFLWGFNFRCRVGEPRCLRRNPPTRRPQADTLEYGLKRRSATRAEPVGWGSMPNPHYIAVIKLPDSTRLG